MKYKKTPAIPPTMRKGEVGRRNGHTRIVVYLRPEHVERLEHVASGLAKARGVLRPDMSAALREVLDSAWGWE